MAESRGVLFATVSALALSLPNGGALAADLAKPAVVVPDLSLARGKFAVTLAAYSFLQTDRGLSSNDYFAFDALKPLSGWGAAFGANYRFANSPWSVGLNAHFGKSNKKSKSGLASTFTSSSGSSSSTVDHYKWDRSTSHAIVDFAVGRDMGFGQTKVGDSYLELQAGLRYARLRDTYHMNDHRTLLSSGSVNSSYDISYSAKRSFTGFGPRFGFKSSIPIGQSQFTFDSGAGVSVLFGHSSTSWNEDFGKGREGSSSAHRTTLGLDVALGLSYLMSPNAKISAGYRGEYFSNVFDAVERTKLISYDSQSKNFMTHAAYVEATLKF